MGHFTILYRENKNLILSHFKIHSIKYVLHSVSQKLSLFCTQNNFKIFKDNKTHQDNLKRINYDFNFKLCGS